MQLPPTRIMLAWPTPNYVDPPTRGPGLVITSVIFMVLISVAVPLRILSRWRKVTRLGLDDIFIIVAYFFSMALSIDVILAYEKYQWNRHLWDVEFTMFERTSIAAFIAKVTFTLAATFTRVSLICFYFRLVKDAGHRLFNYILWASMIYNCAVGITFVFLIVFLCTPVQAYWEFPAPHNSTCLNEGHTTFTAGILNCISDLLVTILPIPIIMRLNMPLKQRIAVTLLLSLGFVVTVAGITRTYYIWRTLLDTFDETWDSMPLYISATVEIDLGVLCACAPSLKPLFTPMVTEVVEMISTVARRGHSATNHSNRDEGFRDGRASHRLTRITALDIKARTHHLSVIEGGLTGSRPRSVSLASSQRTILPQYREVGNSDDMYSQWHSQQDVENGLGDRDMEKGWHRDIDWNVKRGLKSGWIQT